VKELILAANILIMKKIIVFLAFSLFAVIAYAQSNSVVAAAKPATPKVMIVEASCGECKFGMEGTGCVLAVKIDGKPYLVDGAQNIDAYGDAHGETGMCNVIRKAEVSGEIKNGKFVATSFKLLPVVKENKL
jgi:hypothetical protein